MNEFLITTINSDDRTPRVANRTADAEDHSLAPEDQAH